MNRADRRRLEKMQKQSGSAVNSPATQALFNRAVAAQNTGNLHEAESLCDAILRQEPSNADALCLMALLFRQRGLSDRSIELLERAVKAAPKRVSLTYELGNAYKLAGDNDKAIRCYERVLKDKPRVESAHNNLGLAYQEQGRLQEAVTCYRNALNIRPDFAEAHNNLGTTLLELGRNSEALAALRRASEAKPGYADAYYNMHPLLISAGDIPGAVAALEQAVSANPHHYPARFHLGIWLDYQGLGKSAQAHFNFVGQHAPQHRHDLDSWAYVKSRLATGTHLLANHFDSLRTAMNQALIPGAVLEFGVRYGLSLNFLATLTEQTIHGFDSFEGLPEAWIGMQAGAYTTHGHLPEVASNVVLHVGWFSDTLPPFVAQHHDAIRFANIDCDIYSSTRTVLEHLEQRLVPGTVLVFDEYICNPNWRNDEYKAFQELVRRSGIHYRYLLFSPYSRQAVVLIEQGVAAPV